VKKDQKNTEHAEIKNTGKDWELRSLLPRFAVGKVGDDEYKVAI
jgi:hypothetical protein